jgi:hypothetical protein
MKTVKAIIYTKKNTKTPLTAHIYLKGGGWKRIDFIDFDELLTLYEAQEFTINHVTRAGFLLKEEEQIIYSVRLKKSIRNDLQKISDREKIPVSTVIRKAIELLLIREKPNA